MAFKNLIFPALAIAGSAAAQSSCSTSSTTTIQNQGDAAALGACTTYTGSVAIQTDVASAIAINSLQAITGDLIADNTVLLPSLSGDSLQSIGGKFALTNMTLLTNLNFPDLATVGSIAWLTLPRLNGLVFTTGISEADSVDITDTQLASLQGLTLKSVKEMTISNNNQLQQINLPVKNIDTAFNAEFNNHNMSISLPNLEVANNMTFRNVTNINMPALAGVNASIGFYGCYFETLSLPNLTTIGGDISFIGNDDATNISVASLTKLTGALQMSDNAALADIDGFPDLAQIGGAIDISGNFTNVTLPALKNVQGACNLQSTQTIDSTCDTFNTYHSNGTIQGKVTCAGKQSSPGGLGSTPSSSSTSSQKGAASRELYARSSAVTGVLGVFAALLGML